MGQEQYTDPNIGVTDMSEQEFYPSESLGLDTDVNTPTDPFSDELEMDYSDEELAGYEGSDVGAAGLPGSGSMPFYGPGSPLRPALLDNWLSPRIGPGP